MLLEVEEFSPCIWECACGEGHMVRALQRANYRVIATDLIDRGGIENMRVLDFFDAKDNHNVDIITNPPYKCVKEFVEHALDIAREGSKVAMFLKLTFLEGKARKELFKKYPPNTVYVSSSRLQCAKNGDFVRYGKGVSTAVAYAWYVWQKGYKGDTILKWIN